MCRVFFFILLGFAIFQQLLTVGSYYPNGTEITGMCTPTLIEAMHC
jgi:hypothetical protein